MSQAATGCPVATCVSYANDGAGNQTSRTSPTGVTGFGYDALNRPTTKTQAGVLVSTATYDRASNLTSHADTTGTTAYAYDVANRLVSLAEPGGSCPAVLPNPATANATACTVFRYNNGNQRTGVTYPNGQTITNAFDTAGRAYAGCNPANYTDSTGRKIDGAESCYIGAAAGAISFGVGGATIGLLGAGVGAIPGGIIGFIGGAVGGCAAGFAENALEFYYDQD